MIDAVGGLLGVGLGAAALGSWIAILVYGLKAVRRPLPGIGLWSRSTLWNPANVLLWPERLTPEGQRYRGLCLRAVLVFMACVASGLLIGFITAVGR
jgi:hypothetical protein